MSPNTLLTCTPLPEQKLSIEVGQIYGVHVDDVDLAETHEGQVLEQFASQPTSADDEDAHVLQHDVQQLRRRLELGMGQRAAALQNLRISRGRESE